MIDHTTSTPKLAKRIEEEAKKKGLFSLDAPVSGGEVGAKNGCVVTMVGGREEAYLKAKPLLEAFSSKVDLMGEAGAGQYSKATNQIMLTMNMLGVCEALVFGHKSGLDLERLVALIGGGGAGSFMLDKYGPH